MHKLPEMIIFDYGQTLINEKYFDPLKGNQAILAMACENERNLTAEAMQETAVELFEEIGNVFCGKDPNRRELEVSNISCSRYLYELLGLKFDCPPEEVEWNFWEAAAPGEPTAYVGELLYSLWKAGVRMAVVSNMMNSTESLRRRLNELLPDNHFEFVIASSDYVFRKPNKMIFQIAAAKAGLRPDQIWYCGDNPVCDIEGAFRAGMKPVWYTAYSAYCGNPPDNSLGYVTVYHWKELWEMIRLQTDPALLLELSDKANYIPGGSVCERTAVRGIICRGNLYALIHSKKYGDYKFPGGGMEEGEQLEDTLIREVREETGLTVKPDTIRYYGRTEERRRGLIEDIFYMVSHYFCCETEAELSACHMDAYEIEFGYELEFVTLSQAIQANENVKQPGKVPWVERETAMMRNLLMNEGK